MTNPKTASVAPEKIGNERTTPMKGLHVQVKNAVYEVPLVKGARLTILKGITTDCKPGRLLAIMGPSGSGKTSLLNLIGGKMDTSSGEILLNNNKVKRQHILKLSSYVEQDDSLMSVLTVRETLHLAARLQLPSSKYTEQQKIAVAENVMSSLHINKAADTRVGDPKEGIIGVSGGERKRVSTGVALVKNPHLLLCDEPTSGLDTATAMIIIRTLRDLARAEQRTIVVTIHQPSSDCFALFDDLLVVQHGNVVYSGEAGMSMDYFESIGFKCPAFSNPADFYFMHVLSVSDEEIVSSGGTRKQQRRSSAAQETREDQLAKAWKNSIEYKKLVAALDSAPNIPLQIADFDGRENRVSFFTQLSLLLGRAFKQVVRNPMRGRARLFQSVVVGLMIGLIYQGLGKSQSSLSDRSGVMFFMVTNTLLSGTTSVITTFANERSTFLREHQGGLYGVGAYFLAKLMVETPIYMVAAMIYYNIVYWMVGLQPIFAKWGTSALVILSVQLTSNSLGILLASMFARIEVAMALMPLVILPMMLFSGFVLNSENVPVYFRWLEAISPIRYGFVGLCRTEFASLNVTCAEEERIKVPAPSCDDISGNESSVRIFDAGCRFESGDDFLNLFLNLDDDGLSVEDCIMYNLIVAFVTTMIAYFGLRRLGSAKGKAG